MIIAPPTIDEFRADPSAVDYGQPSTLSFKTLGAESCSASGGKFGATPICGPGSNDETCDSFSLTSFTTGTHTANTEYTFDCQAAGKHTTKKTTVTVNPPVSSLSVSTDDDRIIYVPGPTGIPQPVRISQQVATAYNGSVDLYWTTDSASSCSISKGAGGAGTINPNPVCSAPGECNDKTTRLSSQKITISEITTDTTYTISCTGNGNEVKTLDNSVSVTVNPPSITSFTANTTAGNITVNYGVPVTLKWASVSAGTCTGTNFDTSNAISNTTGVTVNPLADTTYTLTCTGAGTPATLSRTVTVNPPQITSFTVNDSAVGTAVNYMDSATLRWRSVNAGSCSGTGFDTGGATSNATGVTVSDLTANTTFSLTCSGNGNTPPVSRAVTVIQPPTATLRIADDTLIFPGPPPQYLIANNIQITASPSGGKTSLPYKYKWRYGSDTNGNNILDAGEVLNPTDSWGDADSAIISDPLIESIGSKIVQIFVRTGSYELTNPTAQIVFGISGGTCNDIYRPNLMPNESGYFGAASYWPDGGSQTTTWEALSVPAFGFSWSGACSGSSKGSCVSPVSGAAVNRNESLTVDMDETGGDVSATASIYTAPEMPLLLTPSITAGASDFRVGNSVALTANTYNRSSAYTYQWSCTPDCGTGTASGRTWTTNFSAGGDKTITLTVTDKNATDSGATVPGSADQTATASAKIYINSQAGARPTGSITMPSGPYYAGNSYTFTTVPQTVTNPAYQWMKNGQDVSGATSAAFTTQLQSGANAIGVRLTGGGNTTVLETTVTAGVPRKRRLKAYVVPPANAPIADGKTEMRWCAAHNSEENGAETQRYPGGGYAYAWTGSKIVGSPSGNCIVTKYTNADIPANQDSAMKSVTVRVTSLTGQYANASASVEVFRSNYCLSEAGFTISAGNVFVPRYGGSATVPITVGGIGNFDGPVTLKLDTRKDRGGNNGLPACNDGIAPDYPIGGCASVDDENPDAPNTQVNDRVNPLEQCEESSDGNNEQCVIAGDQTYGWGAITQLNAFYNIAARFFASVFAGTTDPGTQEIRCVNGECRSTSLVVTSDGTPPGPYSLGVVGTSGAIAERTPFTLTVLSDPADTTPPPVPPPPVEATHLECISNSCARVSGAGSDSCTSEGSACSVATPQHLECRSNSCVLVSGAGSNSCSAEGSACTPPPPVPPGGSLPPSALVVDYVNTSFTLSCTSPTGNQRNQTIWVVTNTPPDEVPPQDPTIRAFYAQENPLQTGNQTDFIVGTQDAAKCVLSGQGLDAGGYELPVMNGNIPVPTLSSGSYTYTLSCYRDTGAVSSAPCGGKTNDGCTRQSIALIVANDPSTLTIPTIQNFYADPNPIDAGNDTALTWNVTGAAADACSVSRGDDGTQTGLPGQGNGFSTGPIDGVEYERPVLPRAPSANEKIYIFEAPATYTLKFKDKASSCGVSSESIGDVYDAPDPDAIWPDAQFSVGQQAQRTFTNIGRGTYRYRYACEDNSEMTSVVRVIERPSCGTFSANGESRTEIVLPQKATLSWSCTNVRSCFLTSDKDGQVANMPLLNPETGDIKVQPGEATRYTLTCTSPDGFTSSKSVTVSPFTAGLREVIPQ